MDIRGVALELKRWAQANHMISLIREAPTYDQGLIRSAFGTVGIPAATRILQDKGISCIGINENKREISVVTRKRLRVSERRLLSAAMLEDEQGDISITFMTGATPKAGPSAPPPAGVAPFTEHMGRYSCGSSVYLGSEKGAGTLGCLVRDRGGGQLYGLSNNHVTGGCNYAPPGLPIVGPGSLDVMVGGMDPRTLGHHEESYPFIDGLPDAVDASNNLDAAIFKIIDEDLVTSMQRNFYDTPSECVPIEMDMEVWKVGRTTGRTKGKVVAEYPDFEAVEYQVDLISGRKIVYFQSLYGIVGDSQEFAQTGDSGALVVANTGNVNKAVGIIVAVNDTSLTFVHSLHKVLEHFDVELVSAHNT